MAIAEVDWKRDLPAPAPSTNWRTTLRFGYLVVLLGLGSFVAWASLFEIDSAALAPGVVAAESNRKTIQHLEGGIVKELLVRDGAQVKKDELLLRLDPLRVGTQGDLFKNQLAILLAQEARLVAEYEERDTLEFPDEVTARSAEPSVAPVISDQRRLFEARRDALARNTEIAETQLEQARKEIEQVEVEIATSKNTLAQIDEELDSLRPLLKRKLVPTTRVAPLERERLQLLGTADNGKIQIVKLKERVDEFALKRDQVVQTYREEASAGLVDVRKQISDVRQEIVLADDGIKRAEIRAPIDGTVQQLRIFTVGGVIRPGEPILDIAPVNEELLIQSRVNPNDADRVAAGMGVEIKFPSFNYWGEQVIRGTVRSISQDRIVDEESGESFFAAQIVVDRSTVPSEISDRLIAGLSAEVIVATGKRTVANYLLRPLYERFDRSLRER
jgi:HlyD family type I secretion membrane fusion protein